MTKDYNEIEMPEEEVSVGISPVSGIDMLAEYVFLSKYSQRKSDGNLESWNETVERIYAMHEKKLKKLGLWNVETEVNINRAKSLEMERVILSSQRGRQFASVNENSGILKHEAKIYNCSSTYVDRVEAFSEIQYLLLCGCGVGYSLHKAYVDKLPVVKELDENKVRSVFVAEDSIEGWADSTKELITALFNGEVPNIDLSLIRPEGALIDGKFFAPGPEPLKTAHERVKKVMLGAQGRKLKTIEVHDIICHIANSVVSGGVRRSAMIALFDKDDNDMLTAKTGSWYVDNPQRAMANNSILTSYGDTLSYSELKAKLEVIRQFGEPGFVNVPSYDYVVNPCAEIVMKPTDGKETGFAFCNLVEINAEQIKTKEEFMRACKLASFVATVQALYTDFKYIYDASKRIAVRDRAVGVSITGIYANPKLRGEVLSEGASEVARANEFWASNFGINRSRTCTTVKPSGNASSILGLHCSGIHPAHAEKYIRRVRVKESSPEYQALKDTPLTKSENGEFIISFPISVDRPDMVYKDNVSAVEHLKFIAMVKHYWVNKGSVVKRAVPNNVSATVEVLESEWGEVAAVLYSNDHLFTGVSMLPKLGDQIYQNAPLQRLSSPETEKEFEDMMEYISSNSIDWNAIMRGRENIHSGDMVATACAGGACEI